MLSYGRRKRKSKLHPHDKCKVCGENVISKKGERQRAKKEIVNENLINKE